MRDRLHQSVVLREKGAEKGAGGAGRDLPRARSGAEHHPAEPCLQDEGRNFQVQVALGEQAGDEVRDEMLASLSSLVVDRCPPAEPPTLVSEYGSLTPDQGATGNEVTCPGRRAATRTGSGLRSTRLRCGGARSSSECRRSCRVARQT